MAKDDAVVVVTGEVVAAMIAEAINGLLTKEQLAAAMEELGFVVSTEVPGVSLGEEVAQQPIDPAHLDGLMFQGSKRKKGKEGEKDVHVPFERPLQPRDVLSWRDTPTHVHIATADGKKHQVKK